MNIPAPVNDRFESGHDLGRIPPRHHHDSGVGGSSSSSVCSAESSGQASVNFSETQLGQILKRQGVKAWKDFEVPVKAISSLDGTKKHLFRRGSCVASTASSSSSLDHGVGKPVSRRASMGPGGGSLMTRVRGEIRRHRSADGARPTTTERNFSRRAGRRTTDGLPKPTEQLQQQRSEEENNHITVHDLASCNDRNRAGPFTVPTNAYADEPVEMESKPPKPMQDVHLDIQDMELVPQETFHDDTSVFSGDDLYMTQFGYKCDSSDNFGYYRDDFYRSDADEPCQEDHDLEMTPISDHGARLFREKSSASKNRDVSHANLMQEDQLQEFTSWQIRQSGIFHRTWSKRAIWRCAIFTLTFLALAVTLSLTTFSKNQTAENGNNSQPPENPMLTSTSPPKPSHPSFDSDWSQATADNPVINFVLHPTEDNTVETTNPVAIVVPNLVYTHVTLYSIVPPRGSTNDGSICDHAALLPHAHPPVGRGQTALLTIPSVDTQIIACSDGDDSQLLGSVTHLFVQHWSVEQEQVRIDEKESIKSFAKPLAFAFYVPHLFYCHNVAYFSSSPSIYTCSPINCKYWISTATCVNTRLTLRKRMSRNACICWFSVPA